MKLTFAAVFVCLAVGCVLGCENVTQERVRQALAAWAQGKYPFVVGLNNKYCNRDNSKKGTVRVFTHQSNFSDFFGKY